MLRQKGQRIVAGVQLERWRSLYCGRESVGLVWRRGNPAVFTMLDLYQLWALVNPRGLPTTGTVPLDIYL